jgi:hypothetical protein
LKKLEKSKARYKEKNDEIMKEAADIDDEEVLLHTSL